MPRTTTTERPDASLYGIKPRFVQALEPIRRTLDEHDVAPTTVTLAAIPVEVAVAVLLVVGTREAWLLTPVPNRARSTDADSPRELSLYSLLNGNGACWSSPRTWRARSVRGSWVTWGLGW